MSVRLQTTRRRFVWGLFFFFFLQSAHYSLIKSPTFYLINSKSRLYFYYHHRQWLIRILLYETLGVFGAFVFPSFCHSTCLWGNASLWLVQPPTPIQWNRKDRELSASLPACVLRSNSASETWRRFWRETLGYSFKVTTLLQTEANNQTINITICN